MSTEHPTPEQIREAGLLLLLSDRVWANQALTDNDALTLSEELTNTAENILSGNTSNSTRQN